MHSVAPGPVLTTLGIVPLTTQEYRLADGSKVHRQQGVAVFRYGECVGGADVIFEEGDSNLLGATTLESLGPCIGLSAARAPSPADCALSRALLAPRNLHGRVSHDAALYRYLRLPDRHVDRVHLEASQD